MDGTYAPQSPDLSSFLSSPSKSHQQPQHTYQPTSNSQSSYAPRSPVIPSFNTQSQHHNLHSYQLNSQHSPFGGDGTGIVGGNEFGEYGNNQYMPPIPALPPSHSFNNAQATSPYFPNPNAHSNSPIKSEYAPYTDADADGDYIPSPTMSRAPRGQKGQSSSSAFQSQSAPAPSYRNPNPNNIEIKTKFPVARIKRIMQADEEVGKVAQVTPVAVSKALELFMIALVSGAAEKAREKGGKRVTAQHLKMVVEGDEQFDFLGEIVGRVADVQEGAGGEGKKAAKKKRREESSDSEEEERKGKGRRRKGL